MTIPYEPMFLFKKLVAPLLYPLPVCLEILLAGVALLWFTRRQQAGKWLVTLGVVLLALMGQGVLSGFMAKPLESQYSPLDSTPLIHESISPIAWIVVLGGGQISDPRLPLTSQISDWSLVRLIEGIRLHRALPESKLVLSAGAVFDPVPEAETMAKLAQALGVDQTELVIEGASKDTAEQVQRLKTIVGRDRFILVTSAVHMPRAMALFEKLGLHPLPAPTGFFVKESHGFDPAMFYPKGNNFYLADIAMHEYMGLVWAKVTR